MEFKSFENGLGGRKALDSDTVRPRSTFPSRSVQSSRPVAEHRTYDRPGLTAICRLEQLASLSDGHDRTLGGYLETPCKTVLRVHEIHVVDPSLARNEWQRRLDR